MILGLKDNLGDSGGGGIAWVGSAIGSLRLRHLHKRNVLAGGGAIGVVGGADRVVARVQLEAFVLNIAKGEH